MYRTDAERRVLELNLERARALPVRQRPLRDRQPARGAALHVRERAGGGFDAGRRRPPRPHRADADDERLHPLRRAQSLLEFAAGHHRASGSRRPSSRRAAPISGTGATSSCRIGPTTRGSSTRCRSTGMRLPPDECRLACGKSRDRPIRWGKMKFMFPNRAGDLAPRHPRTGEDRGCRAAAEQRLRPARRCDAARALAVQRPAAKPEGREARAEGQSARRRCRSTSPI